MTTKNLVPLAVGICAVLLMVFPVNAQGELQEAEIPFMHFIDRNDNNIYDAGIDTHIRWGGFNYTLFDSSGDIVSEGTVYLINRDLMVMFMLEGDVVAIQRVGGCEPDWVWGYDNYEENTIIMIEWEELGNCEDPADPFVEFEGYKVNLPFITFR